MRNGKERGRAACPAAAAEGGEQRVPSEGRCGVSVLAVPSTDTRGLCDGWTGERMGVWRTSTCTGAECGRGCKSESRARVLCEKKVPRRVSGARGAKRTSDIKDVRKMERAGKDRENGKSEQKDRENKKNEKK